MEYSKPIILAFLMTFLVGCASKEVKTVFVDKPVPYIVVPEPPKIKRPDLETLNLTQEQIQKDGEVAKAYLITVGQLVVYAELLEKVVLKYGELAKMNEQERNVLRQKVEQNILLSGYTKTYSQALEEELNKTQQ